MSREKVSILILSLTVVIPILFVVFLYINTADDIPADAKYKFEIQIRLVDYETGLSLPNQTKNSVLVVDGKPMIPSYKYKYCVFYCNSTIVNQVLLTDMTKPSFIIDTRMDIIEFGIWVPQESFIVSNEMQKLNPQIISTRYATDDGRAYFLYSIDGSEYKKTYHEYEGWIVPIVEILVPVVDASKTIVCEWVNDENQTKTFDRYLCKVTKS